MARYLVVANQTLGGEALLAELRTRVEAGKCELHVVVPATGAAGTPGVLSGGGTGPGAATVPESGSGAADPYRRAEQRLRSALARFSELGAAVDGEVGDPNPLTAIEDALGREQVDEVILSTLPSGVSRWLGMDLPSRVRRRVDVPVTHVEGPRGGSLE